MVLEIDGMVDGRAHCHVKLEEIMTDDKEDGKFARWVVKKSLFWLTYLSVEFSENIILKATEFTKGNRQEG